MYAIRKMFMLLQLKFVFVFKKTNYSSCYCGDSLFQTYLLLYGPHHSLIKFLNSYNEDIFLIFSGKEFQILAPRTLRE